MKLPFYNSISLEIMYQEQQQQQIWTENLPLLLAYLRETVNINGMGLGISPAPLDRTHTWDNRSEGKTWLYLKVPKEFYQFPSIGPTPD